MTDRTPTPAATGTGRSPRLLPPFLAQRLDAERLGTPCTWARNLVLLGGTAWRQGREDPVHFLVQASRRLPARPRRLLGAALGVLPGRGPRALSAHLGGNAQWVRALTGDVVRAGGPASALTAELAVASGAVVVGRDAALDALPAPVRARALWKAGRAGDALAVLEAEHSGSALARRLRGETRTWAADYAGPFPAPGLPQAARTAPSSGPDGPGAPIRALHLLVNSLPHTQSGYTLRSHRLLSALVGQGTPVVATTRLGYPVLVGIPWGGDRQEIDGVAYRRILAARLAADLPGRLEQQVRRTLRAVGRFRPDVVHCTTPYTNALMAQAVARALGVPWVYEVRGLLEETWVAGQPDDAARAAARRSERFAALRAAEDRMMRSADHVLTLSEVMRETLVARGIPGDRITVVPNAVSEEFFRERPAPAAARRAAGLPSATLPSTGEPQAGDDEAGETASGAPAVHWVGSVSSLVDYEGFDVLLRAVALLREQGRDVRVLLAGDGVAAPSLRRLAEELGLGEAAVFTGRVDPERARELHGCLDVFAVPRRDVSVCRQVTPLKPIEAMAAGTPVVVSDLPPLRELIGVPDAAGRAPRGAVAAPGDVQEWAERIWEACSDPVWRRETAARARDFARERTWAENARRVQRVYRRLLGTAG